MVFRGCGVYSHVMSKASADVAAFRAVVETSIIMFGGCEGVSCRLSVYSVLIPPSWTSWGLNIYCGIKTTCQTYATLDSCCVKMRYHSAVKIREMFANDPTHDCINEISSNKTFRTVSVSTHRHSLFRLVLLFSSYPSVQSPFPPWGLAHPF